MISNSYEDTTIFIFRVWVFPGYITIPYNQVPLLTLILTSSKWAPELTLNNRLLTTLD